MFTRGKNAAARTASRFVEWFVELSYAELSILWLGVVVAFAAGYWFLAEMPGQGPTGLAAMHGLERYLNALYFSVMTGTTVGYGDIVPLGLSKVAASFQAVMSFVILALFVAKFAAHRQELTLADIHQLAFDSSFHTIRNGLFIARKDIDVVMKRVLESRDLTKKDWANLKTALRQMQIFTKHIPDFYKKTAKTHAFDIDREMLLIDSLERTLTRLVEALNLFREKGIAFLSEERVVRELHSLIHQIENLSLHEEQKSVDPENHEAFQEIISRAEDIRVHLQAGA